MIRPKKYPSRYVLTDAAGGHLEAHVLLDEAIRRAARHSRLFGDTTVVWERDTRHPRAVAKNGLCAWQKSCVDCKGAGETEMWFWSGSEAEFGPRTCVKCGGLGHVEDERAEKVRA